MLWYAAAYAAGELLVRLKAMGVLLWPNDLILIVSIFIKSLVITLLMKCEYSAWPLKRLAPAIMAFFIISAVDAAWTLWRQM